jgi:hypothetical protein
MKFTIQFQEFSEQRQQWLTIVFVCKVGLLRFLLYVLRIIEWTFRDGDAYPIHRVVITQGIVDISVANSQERTLLPLCKKCGQSANNSLHTNFKKGNFQSLNHIFVPVICD